MPQGIMFPRKRRPAPLEFRRLSPQQHFPFLSFGAVLLPPPANWWPVSHESRHASLEAGNSPRMVFSSYRELGCCGSLIRATSGFGGD